MRLFRETLLKNTTTSSFEVTNLCQVTINIMGTYDGETVELQASPDNSTFADYYVDGQVATWSASIEGRAFDLVAGYYRFVSSNGAGTMDVDIYVDGRQCRY
jgi:hypothetical protein